MRACLVSDNRDTLVGLQLAGIDGVVVHGRAETAAAVKAALGRDDVAILVMTERAAEAVPEMVQAIRESGDLPILVEIPDRHGTTRGSDFLTKYVRDAIGVKME